MFRTPTQRYCKHRLKVDTEWPLGHEAAKFVEVHHVRLESTTEIYSDMYAPAEVAIGPFRGEGAKYVPHPISKKHVVFCGPHVSASNAQLR